MTKKPLWIQNNTSTDISLSDIGVRVRSKGTVNVYAHNPYITEEMVAASRASGSLKKRLASGKISVVRAPVKTNPHGINHIKESDRVVEVVKTKSAVVVDTKQSDVLGDEDLLDIADYGTGDLDIDAAKPVLENGMVTIRQSTLEEPEPAQSPKTTIESVKSNNGQGPAVVVTQTSQNATEATKNASPNNQPQGVIVVTSQTESDEPEVLTEPQPDFDTKVATKTKAGAVVMELKEEEKAEETPKKKDK